MPRPQTNDLKSKKPGRHRARRQKWAATEPKFLYSGAPLGEYVIDEVALDLFSSGRAAGATDPTELVKEIRTDINMAARMASIDATNQFDRAPRRRWLAKRFLEDLRGIRSRIERNKNVSSFDLVLSIHPITHRPLKYGVRVDVSDLLPALQNMSKLIDGYLERHKLARGGGDHDHLTRTFIAEVFMLWCCYYSGEPSHDESRLFMRLLCAAWRDVGFSTEVGDGVRFESWLTDRVRKQFREGIHSARVSREEFIAPQPPDPDPSAPPDPN
jgi:hypothetical protein